MPWNREKVFVTGAGGFIGSHLCEALVKAGAEVSALIHYSSRSDWGNLEFLPVDLKANIRVVRGNIEDGDLITKLVKGHTVVFHLAALIAIPYSYQAPLSYVRTNVQGTLNILEAARRNDVQRVIHTSTSETYGTAVYTPIDEKHPLQAQSPYAPRKLEQISSPRASICLLAFLFLCCDHSIPMVLVSRRALLFQRSLAKR
jgi:nucleoside-diphosphate-sugar epimerase